MQDQDQEEKKLTLKVQPEETAGAEESSLPAQSQSQAPANPLEDGGRDLIVKKASRAVPDPLLGAVIDQRYEILSLTGKGATSSVYKAMDLRLKHHVAIKLLHSHLVCDDDIVRRFEQEAHTAGLIAHPNCVAIYDGNKTADDQPYFVMDYVEGESLQQIIKQEGCLPLERAIRIFTQVCAALAAAHEKGIVHRDLKPGNILVQKNAKGEDFVKVLDFGAAKLMAVQGDTYFKTTQTGEMIGSILYMSPEQCLDQDVDARSDIYSLGCVLYEAVAGKPPFCARTAFETMNKHMTDTPERLNRVRPDLHLPGALEKVIFTALAKKPQSRYQSMAAFQDDLVAVSSVAGKPGELTEPDSELQKLAVADNGVALAVTKALKDRLREQAAMRCVAGLVSLFFPVVGTITFFSNGNLDPFFLVAMYCPLLFLVMIWNVHASRLKRFGHMAKIASSVRPEKMLLTRLERDPGSLNKYWLDVSSIDAPGTGLKRLMIDWDFPVALSPATTFQGAKFWEGLSTASQMERLTGSSTVFPALCHLYIDPDTQEPVAILVSDFLGFVAT